MDYKYLKHLARRGASYIHPRGFAATRLLIEELELKTNQKILEVGCGTGATIAEILAMFDVYIDGIDALNEMLTAARDRMDFLDLSAKVNLSKVTPGDKLPFEDNTFDRIYTESVLGFQTRESFKFILSEIFRVLKTGGIFLTNEAMWKENVTDDTVKLIYESSEKDFGIAQASPSNININFFLYLCGQIGFKKMKQVNLNELSASNNISRSKQSEKFSTSKKLRSLFSFSFLIDEINFRRKLRNHKRDGFYIESFLLKFAKSGLG